MDSVVKFSVSFLQEAARKMIKAKPIKRFVIKIEIFSNDPEEIDKQF
jgi:hypothetical protein